MLGTRRMSVPKKLSARVKRIATAPTCAPQAPDYGKFDKRAERTTGWRPGTLIFLGGERLKVVVKNISDTGARIEFVRSTQLPERVQLVEPIRGVKRSAYVIWQDWGVAGLQFVDRPKSQPRGA